MFGKSSMPVADAGQIRLLNQPRPIVVIADGNGLPRRIETDVGQRQVTQIVDIWRIDDEWWRSPVSRRYFLVALDDGVVRTMFHDLIGGGWYEQHA